MAAGRCCCKCGSLSFGPYLRCRDSDSLDEKVRGDRRGRSRTATDGPGLSVRLETRSKSCHSAAHTTSGSKDVHPKSWAPGARARKRLPGAIWSSCPIKDGQDQKGAGESRGSTARPGRRFVRGAAAAPGPCGRARRRGRGPAAAAREHGRLLVADGLRGPRARQLQAEFGSAVSAEEAEEVMRYAGGSVEVAGALLRNKLGLPRKRKRDGNEEAELSMREVEIERLQVKAYEYLCRVVSLKSAELDARANAQNFLNSDQEFVRSITQSLKRDASIQDAAVRELVESPTDEIAEKVVSAILDGDLIDDMPDAVKALMENEHLRDAVRDELHDDDELAGRGQGRPARVGPGRPPRRRRAAGRGQEGDRGRDSTTT